MLSTEMNAFFFFEYPRRRTLLFFLGLALRGDAAVVEHDLGKALRTALVGRLEKAFEVHESAAVGRRADEELFVWVEDALAEAERLEVGSDFALLLSEDLSDEEVGLGGCSGVLLGDELFECVLRPYSDDVSERLGADDVGLDELPGAVVLLTTTGHLLWAHVENVAELSLCSSTFDLLDST